MLLRPTPDASAISSRLMGRTARWKADSTCRVLAAACTNNGSSSSSSVGDLTPSSLLTILRRMNSSY
ncbi:Uncharacterised protein [Bordetella pertussis]|nr:Uncharacterised protein [Bordetella pertussis]